MKFPVSWPGLCCYTEGWGGKCSEILATIKLLYNPRVNKVFTSLHLALFTASLRRLFPTFIPGISTLWGLVIVKNKLTSVSYAFHSHFDNVMTQFIINKRTDAQKSDVNLLTRAHNESKNNPLSINYATAIGLKISRHFFIQSKVIPTPIVTRSRTFSLASRPLHIITSSFDWLS